MNGLRNPNPTLAPPPTWDGTSEGGLHGCESDRKVADLTHQRQQHWRLAGLPSATLKGIVLLNAKALRRLLPKQTSTRVAGVGRV